MRAASLKLYKGIQNVDIMNNNADMPRVALRALLSSLGVLALIYALLLGVMVWNIVDRKNMEKEQQVLAAELGDLELRYLALSGSLDMELSRAMGFTETRASFAPKRSLGYSSTDEASAKAESARNEI